MMGKAYNKQIWLLISGFFPGLVFILLSVLIVSCAVQAPISGGEKDVTPPKVVSSVPANFSTNFTGNRIVITFNEFATLKDIDKQKLISPPMAVEPDFKMRGKSLVLTFKESLQKDATYSIYMGNAIVDLTEGNPLKDYSFVFSTGSKIDSLTVSGSVLDALQQTAPKDATAMLYEGTSDSLPYLSRPLYVARVDDNGDFRLKNLREGNYKLIVLQDLNGNFLYDKGEAIAYADTLVPAHHLEPQKLDSAGKPIQVRAGKIKKKALAMFKESDSTQRILRSALVAPHHIQLVYRMPVKNPKLKKSAGDSTEAWYLGEANAGHDTLNFWLKNMKSDSLRFYVNDGDKILDTLNISLTYKGKGAAREGAKSKLSVKTNIPRGGSLSLHTPLMLVSENPLQKADFSSFKLTEDSIPLRPKVQFLDNLKRHIIFKNTLKEDTQYQLIIPDSVFEDMYGSSNDSIFVKFKTHALADYGSLSINIHMKKPKSYIIQLLSESGKVMQQNPIKADGKIAYPYLLPGKYKLNAIVDSNRNGKWDTGIYLKHLQPEQIILFPKVLEIRANWEQDEDWQL